MSVRLSGKGLTQWTFPCGEAGIKINGEEIAKLGQGAHIMLKFQGNDDLFALAQLVDALRYEGVEKIYLTMPYLPYSRQDRRCVAGEGHALKVFGNFINSLGFSEVTTWDAHSYVAEAVINNLYNRSQRDCALGLPVHEFLIGPDAGAAKKVYTHEQVVKELCLGVLVADKERGPDGKIIKTIVPNAHRLRGRTVCVVDDICDGGATFVKLAEAIYSETSPKELNLYVTHGFFTKGLEDLRQAGYTNIYVNNLMRPEFKDVEFIQEI